MYKRQEVATAAPDADTAQLQALLVPVYAHAVRSTEGFIFDRAYREVAQQLLLRITALGLLAGSAKPGSGAPAAADTTVVIGERAGRGKGKGGVLPEEAIAHTAAALQATLHRTVDAALIAHTVGAAGLGAPLLVDGNQRAAALKRAFHAVKLGPLARDIFALAAHP